MLKFSEIKTDVLLLSVPALLLGSLLGWCLSTLGWDWLQLLSLGCVLTLLFVGYLRLLLKRYVTPWRYVAMCCDALKSNEHNLRLAHTGLPRLTSAALAELTSLQQRLALQQQGEQQQWLLFRELWQLSPYPVLLLDAESKLTFANKAAADFLARPLLQQQAATLCGLQAVAGGYALQQCPTGWREHCSQLQLAQQQFTLWYALDLRQPLHAEQRRSHSELVRVLSHELRNSLTPMASMTETLLGQQQWQESQVRQVLQRIGDRASRLLKFIAAYREVSQLPEPQPRWFRLDELAQSCADLLSCPLQFQGLSWCYADPMLFEQLLLNLLKNALEAQQQLSTDVAIRLSFYREGQQQHLQIVDQGPGFANPANLFTPFYTTKAQGLGVGMTLCRDILHLHQGELTACNHSDGGACLSANWPAPDTNPL
jgi:two-component system, NtrC family, nitrogen regulation sensor histidine kinase NtrY